MMKTLLQTIASVIATCIAISSRPALLRISAFMTGRISMALLLGATDYCVFSCVAGCTWQARQVGYRPASRLAASAISNVMPTIVQSSCASFSVAVPAYSLRNASRPSRSGSRPKQAAGDADDARLGQVLREHRRLAGAHRAAQSDLGALPMNFASSRPTVLIRHTARKAKASHTWVRASRLTTRCDSSHSDTVRNLLLSGRGKRPSFFCSST